MKIEYTKSYPQVEYKHFSIYGKLSNNTAVFYEYYNLLKESSDLAEEELTEKVRSYNKESKSNIRISYSEDRIEFFTCSKYVFPEFYIIFKNDKQF